MIPQLQNGSETPKPRSATNGLLGEVRFVKDRADPEGLVFVHGEYFRAKAKEKLEPEDEADGLDGLVLEVKKAINHSILSQFHSSLKF